MAKKPATTPPPPPTTPASKNKRAAPPPPRAPPDPATKKKKKGAVAPPSSPASKKKKKASPPPADGPPPSSPDSKKKAETKPATGAKAEKGTKDSASEVKAAAVEEMPMDAVGAVVREKLSALSSSAASGGDGEEVFVHKDAMVAFSEAARVFIHYLSAAANDVCSEANRQIMNGEDVLKALGDVDFPEFVQPLKAALAEFKLKNEAKKSKKGKDNEGEKIDVDVAEESED